MLSVLVSWYTYSLLLYTLPVASTTYYFSDDAEIAIQVVYTALNKSRAGHGVCRVASPVRNLSCLVASLGTASGATPPRCGHINPFRWDVFRFRKIQTRVQKNTYSDSEGNIHTFEGEHIHHHIIIYPTLSPNPNHELPLPPKVC